MITGRQLSPERKRKALRMRRWSIVWSALTFGAMSAEGTRNLLGYGRDGIPVAFCFLFAAAALVMLAIEVVCERRLTREVRGDETASDEPKRFSF